MSARSASAVEETVAILRDHPFPTRAPLPAAPTPALDTRADSDLAYACAHCDALEIAALDREYRLSARRHRDGECAMIVKRIKKIMGQDYHVRTRVFADGWFTTW
jgi:hypothetical protein